MDGQPVTLNQSVGRRTDKTALRGMIIVSETLAKKGTDGLGEDPSRRGSDSRGGPGGSVLVQVASGRPRGTG